MRTLFYLLFLACLVPLVFCASLVRWTQSLASISRAWARLRIAANWPNHTTTPRPAPAILKLTGI